MKPMILTLIAAAGLLAQNAPATAQKGATPADSKGSASAPAASTDTKKPVKKRHKSGSSTSNANTNKTQDNASKPAAPAATK